MFINVLYTYIQIHIYIQLSFVALDFTLIYIYIHPLVFCCFRFYFDIYIYVHICIDTFRFDAFSGTDAHTIGELALRDTFAKDCNVRFMCRPPGGWSEWGLPCDDVHADFSWDLKLFFACKHIIYMYIYLCINMFIETQLQGQHLYTYIYIQIDL
jgi:hypothetical protein